MTHCVRLLLRTVRARRLQFSDVMKLHARAVVLLEMFKTQNDVRKKPLPFGNVENVIFYTRYVFDEIFRILVAIVNNYISSVFTLAHSKFCFN